MVVFKNRYMVLEMVVGHGLRLADVKITQNDVASAIQESLLVNFGEYGLASSLPSLQGIDRNVTPPPPPLFWSIMARIRIRIMGWDTGRDSFVLEKCFFFTYLFIDVLEV